MPPRRSNPKPPDPSTSRPSRPAKDKAITTKPWLSEEDHLKRKRAESAASSSTRPPAKKTKKKEERNARQFMARGLDDATEPPAVAATTDASVRTAASSSATSGAAARVAVRTSANGETHDARRALSDVSMAHENEQASQATRPARKPRVSKKPREETGGPVKSIVPAPRMDEHRTIVAPLNTQPASKDGERGMTSRDDAARSLNSRSNTQSVGPVGSVIGEDSTTLRNGAGCSFDMREPALLYRAIEQEVPPALRMDEHRTIGATLNTQSVGSNIVDDGATRQDGGGLLNIRSNTRSAGSVVEDTMLRDDVARSLGISITPTLRMDEHRTIVAPLSPQSARSINDQHDLRLRNGAGNSFDTGECSLSLDFHELAPSRRASAQGVPPGQGMDEHRTIAAPSSAQSAKDDDEDGTTLRNNNSTGRSLDIRELAPPRRASAQDVPPAPHMDEQRTIVAPLSTQSARGDDEDGTTSRNNTGRSLDIREFAPSRRASAQGVPPAQRMDEHRTIAAPSSAQSAKDDDEGSTTLHNNAGRSLDIRKFAPSRRASAQGVPPAQRMDEHRTIAALSSSAKDDDEGSTTLHNNAGRSLDIRKFAPSRRASAQGVPPAPRMDEHRTIAALSSAQSAKDDDEGSTTSRNNTGRSLDIRKFAPSRRASAQGVPPAPRMDEHRTIAALSSAQSVADDTLSIESRNDDGRIFDVHGPSLSHRANPRRIDTRRSSCARAVAMEAIEDEDEGEGEYSNIEVEASRLARPSAVSLANEDVSDGGSTYSDNEQQMITTAGAFAQEAAFMLGSDSDHSEDTTFVARNVRSRRTPLLAVDDNSNDSSSDNGGIVLPRRRAKQVAELPVFREADDYSDANDTTPTTNRATPAAAPTQETDMVELAWHESARIVKGKKFQLKPQNEHIKNVVSVAKEALPKYIQLSTPFPDSQQKDKIVMEVLTEAALCLEEADIHSRLTADKNFVLELGKLVRNHMNKVRNVVLVDDIKNIVKNEYGISDEYKTSVAQVKALLLNHSYVHADITNKKAGTLFTAPAIKILAAKAFFTKNGCTHDRFPESFRSSDSGRTQAKEIPAPTVALVATSIFYVLSNYHRDPKLVAPDFNSPSCVNAYGEHMKSLAMLELSAPSKYRKLLRGLYNAVLEGLKRTLTAGGCYADDLDGWSDDGEDDGEEGVE